MEPNEVMANEELIETTTEEVVEASSRCGCKVAAGFGSGILAGMAICKLAKPVMAKIKARREAKRMESDVVVDVDVEVAETDEESEK